MKSLLLTIIISLSISPLFGQCFFGFEHVTASSGDSSVVIKKYGFPPNAEFRLIQTFTSHPYTLDTLITSHANDTLSFVWPSPVNVPSIVDTIGSIELYGISPAGDTLGYFKSETGVGFPTNLDVLSYIPPSTLSSFDGEIEFYTDSITGVQTGFSLDGGSSITTVFDSLTAGIVKGVYQDGPFEKWDFSFIIGNPSDWVNVDSGAMTCPIGVNLASEAGACDGEAYINGVQNGTSPYTYDWNGNNNFVADTIVSGLCVGNQLVIIKDDNNLLKTCAFVMGSIDVGYFPPVQTNDTIIHTFADYCIDPSIDSISLIGSAIIDSFTISVIWSFYSGNVLFDQMLDTVYLNSPNPIYNNVELHLHLICNGDTLKALTSVYSTYGYFSLPFTETGVLSLIQMDKNFNLIAYPNPIDDFLHLEVNASEVEKITVYNGLGQEIKVKKNIVSDKLIQIDFRSVSKGNYVVNIVTTDNKLHTKKVVKN